MNYQYFTAFDMKYAWWATHLASSIFKNSPDSNFTAFLIAKKSEEDSEEVEGTIEIIQQANPNCRVELTIIKDDIDYDGMGNQGRFPKIKKQTKLLTIRNFINRIIVKFKLK